MITKITLLASTILLYATSVQAQNTLKVLRVNDPIVQRDSLSLEATITTEIGVLDATLKRVVGDSLLVVHRGLIQSISINSIHSITVHTNKTRLVVGAVIGVVVGGVSGGIIGDGKYEEPAPTSGDFNINMSGFERGIHTAVGAIVGVVIGGSVAGLIGYANKIDDVYDLSSMTLPGKVKRIQFLLERESENQ